MQTTYRFISIIALSLLFTVSYGQTNAKVAEMESQRSKLEQEIKLKKVDIDDSVWQGLQDQINERLVSMGLNPIRIDFETGNLEEVVDTVQSELERLTSSLSQGVGAVSTLGNAFDDLKNIDPEKVVDNFASVFDKIVSSFEWIKNNWEGVKTGLMAIAGAFGVMKIATLFLNISNAVTAFQNLHNPTGSPVQPTTGSPVQPTTGSPVQPTTGSPVQPRYSTYCLELLSCG